MDVNAWIRLGNVLERTTNVVTAVLTATMSLVVCWQVVARYVLNTGHFWASEFAVICMFWLALVGAAGALWSGDHIGLRIIIERLPTSVRNAAQVLIELFVGAFAILLAVQGLELVERTSGGNWSALRIPLGYTYVVLPLSAALMGLLGIMKGALRALALAGIGEVPQRWLSGQEGR